MKIAQNLQLRRNKEKFIQRTNLMIRYSRFLQTCLIKDEDLISVVISALVIVNCDCILSSEQDTSV